MNVFTWLLIGHLIGDWLLQNHWMANGKKKGLVTLPGMVHFAIYTAAMTGALWFSEAGHERSVFYLVAALYFFASHWLIDVKNVAGGWMRVYRQSNLTTVQVMDDQTLHILTLVALGLSLRWL